MIMQVQVDEITKKIVEYFQPKKIILFGSYAYGTPTEESDLDLLILKDSDLPTRLQNRRVRKLLAGSRIPVDVLVKTPHEFEIYKDIVGTIIYPAHKFGKVLYEER